MKVMLDNLGLVDFALGEVNSVLTCVIASEVSWGYSKYWSMVLSMVLIKHFDLG